MKNFFSYLSVAIISSCAAQPAPASEMRPAIVIQLPSYFLVAILTTNPSIPPKMISPHFTGQECNNAKKELEKTIEIPPEVEIACLKVVKGIDV